VPTSSSLKVADKAISSLIFSIHSTPPPEKQEEEIEKLKFEHTPLSSTLCLGEDGRPGAL
jgi:hypothetical protein